MSRFVAPVTLFFVVIAAGCGGSNRGRSTTTIVLNPAPAPSIYRVPSASMEPTYGVGSRVVVREGSPSVGAVVVFHPPESAEEGVCGPARHTVEPGGAACEEPIAKEDTSVRFIKRIVAGPGDEIYIREGHIYRKAAGTSTFTREQDSYIAPCEPASLPECNFPTPLKIPNGHWFTMGANRGHSDDSRFWGAVPASWIVGVVTGIE